MIRCWSRVRLYASVHRRSAEHEVEDIAEGLCAFCQRCGGDGQATSRVYYKVPFVAQHIVCRVMTSIAAGVCLAQTWSQLDAGGTCCADLELERRARSRRVAVHGAVNNDVIS